MVLGNAIQGNSGNGIEISGSNNAIGNGYSTAFNLIFTNAGGGVIIDSGKGNNIVRDAIYSNGSSQSGPGILLDSGANNNIVAPTIASAGYNSNKTALTVTGTFTAPVANVTYILDFYEASSNDLEGRVFVGALYLKPTTTGTISFTATTGFLTGFSDMLATLTDGSGDTSAYSRPAIINFS